METIWINNTAFVVGVAVSDQSMTVNGAGVSGSGYTVDPTMSNGAIGKDTLLSSWPFVIGISAAILLVSVALGTFLAKRKIKKGIDLYED